MFGRLLTAAMQEPVGLDAVVLIRAREEEVHIIVVHLRSISGDVFFVPLDRLQAHAIVFAVDVRDEELRLVLREVCRAPHHVHAD